MSWLDYSQVMEHYHSTMSAIKAEANLLQKTKEQASANLQKVCAMDVVILYSAKLL